MNDKIGDSMAHADWNLIPSYMREGVLMYIERGVPPGSFLQAVLKNDLWRAVDCADQTNIQIVHRYVLFFYNYAPSECWGSVDAYEAWIKRGGAKGPGDIPGEREPGKVPDTEPTGT
jgi:hypothetical protein